MLSRKYYKMLADVIKNSNTVDEVKLKLMNNLAMDNPNFDARRFDKACAREEEE